MIFNTSQFSWDLPNLRFIAEASDLGLRPGQVATEIVLQHETTVMWFYLDQTQVQASPDQISWHYCPTPETLAKYPAMKAVRVIILND